MNYAYVSSRVRVLENSIPSNEMLLRLVSAASADERVRILNGFGFDGNNDDEIIRRLNQKKDALTRELFPDRREIEVIFYPKDFHNIKAAAKKLYSKSDADMFYTDTEISGEEIMDAMRAENTRVLPDYMSEAARDVYTVLLRTGDGRLSDMSADKACLTAMNDFAARTKHEILKMYVNETIAAADINLLLRANGREDVLKFAVSNKYFTDRALIKAGMESKSEEFLASVGFGGINRKNADGFFKKRISDTMRGEKYNVFSPAPAINFILEYDTMINTIRYILIGLRLGAAKETISERVMRDV